MKRNLLLNLPQKLSNLHDFTNNTESEIENICCNQIQKETFGKKYILINLNMSYYSN